MAQHGEEANNAIPGKELKSSGPKRYESRAKTTQPLEGPMLIQEKIGGPEALLKLYVAIDEDLKALQPQLHARQLPRDPRGGTPTLSAAEVLTILVWGAWRGLTDKAKVYFHIQTSHRREFPTLGAYSKFVEATNRAAGLADADTAPQPPSARPLSHRAARLDSDRGVSCRPCPSAPDLP